MIEHNKKCFEEYDKKCVKNTIRSILKNTIDFIYCHGQSDVRNWYISMRQFGIYDAFDFGI